MPRPSLKRERTVRPDPLGATRITSTSLGTSTLVLRRQHRYSTVENSQVGEDGAEAVRKVERLALCDQRLDCRPRLALRGVGQEVHDNGSLLDGLVNFKEV